jgi:hypothetical protein
LQKGLLRREKHPPRNDSNINKTKKAVAGAPQPEKTDEEDLETVYRRTTRRQNTSIGTGEDLGEQVHIHVMRSFLRDLPTYLLLSKAVRVYTDPAGCVKVLRRGVHGFLKTMSDKSFEPLRHEER